MKEYLGEDFLLENETAKKLFEFAKEMPIIDYHNHLNIKEIYEDKKFSDITEAWLGGDHYKWRLLRAAGISEDYITGDKSSFEKFEKWASVIPYAIGNPVHQWTQMELKRYFGIDDVLTKDNAKEIYDKCNEMLKKDEFSARNLLKRMNIKLLCTTDDPIDDLEYHKKLKEEDFEIKCLPTYRPEKVMDIEKDIFGEYIKKLSDVSDVKIENIDDVILALSKRLDYFAEVGAKATDHSLGKNIYAKATKEEVNTIFEKGLKNEELSDLEIRKYKGYVFANLIKLYHKHNMICQIHVGAIRNNSKRMFEKIGPDTGFDSVDDFAFADQLSELLCECDYTNELPKTVLYSLNSKDYGMLASMAGNFMDGVTPFKVQFGAAWWFQDSLLGMNAQLEMLTSMGMLAGFVGMLTDSRSFLSFPRHELFRRILCNHIGNIVERGLYPNDMTILREIVENICYNNIKNYLE